MLNRTLALVSLLMAWGIGISLNYGRKGFMPLDHCIIFDGGWRLLQGQLPYRDFNTPFGVVPMVMQAGFFYLLGVNWFAYCLHAAILNGLFCVLVFVLLRLASGGRLLAVFYGLVSGVIFYPPMGVPFSEQHAFFFSFVAIIAVAAMPYTRVGVRSLFIFLLPFFVGLAYFSKQIPSTLLVPVVIMLLFVTHKRRHFNNLIGLLSSGVVVSVGFLAFLFKLWRLDLDAFRLYFFDLPSSLGSIRLDSILSRPQTLLLDLLLSPIWHGSWILITPLLVYFGGITIVLLRRKHWTNCDTGVTMPLILALMLLGACSLFTKFTNNEKENGIPYLFAAVGLTHLALIRFFDSRLIAQPRMEYVYLRPFLHSLFMSFTLFDSLIFQMKVTETRLVTGVPFEQELVEPSTDLPEALRFMQFVPYFDYRARDFKRLVAFLEQPDHSFFLFGNSSVLYGITHNRSIHSALFFHMGLTIPFVGTEQFTVYEQTLLERLITFNVRFIVIEGQTVGIGCRLEDYALLKRLIQERFRFRARFGRFEVLEKLAVP